MNAHDIIQRVTKGIPVIDEPQRSEFVRRHSLALLRRTRAAFGLVDDLHPQAGGLTLIQAVYGAFGREVPPDNAVSSVGGLVRDFYDAQKNRYDVDLLRQVREATEELVERGVVTVVPRPLSTGGAVDFFRATDFRLAHEIWRTRMEPVLEAWWPRMIDRSQNRVRRQSGPTSGRLDLAPEAGPRRVARR